MSHFWGGVVTLRGGRRRTGRPVQPAAVGHFGRRRDRGNAGRGGGGVRRDAEGTKWDKILSGHVKSKQEEIK